MKRIIELPDEVVKAIQNGEDYRYDIHTAIAQSTPYNPAGDLISREALKKDFENLASDDYNEPIWYQKTVFETIDNAPTVELTETEVQEVLNKRCMTAVANEYLIALHGKTERPQGEWIRKVDDVGFVSYICSECGAEIEVEDSMDDKFCFNCGAKMKGGAENDIHSDIESP